MIPVTNEQLQRIAPRCCSPYRAAFIDADQVLAAHAINETALRLCHFLAQVLHETGGLSVLTENLDYKAERLMAVWPKRFPSLEVANPFANNPEALACKVYDGRMGNNTEGDGWKFIGRGMLQLTGRESYEKCGRRLGIDLVKDPEMVIHPQWSLKIAAAEWEERKCNGFADEDDIRKVTLAINGGLVGLDDRAEWLKKTKSVWLPGPSQ